MAGFTRTNGLGVTVGTLYHHNAKGWLVTAKNNSAAAIDLRAEDDAVNEAGELIIKEVSPLMYQLVDANTGLIYMITDPSLSAADIQARLRNLGDGTDGAGVNNVDLRGTTVAAVTGITLT